MIMSQKKLVFFIFFTEVNIKSIMYSLLDLLNDIFSAINSETRVIPPHEAGG